MRHLVRNVSIILAVLFVSACSVWPPAETLRLGKDLAGGVSLTYSVQLQPDDPPGVVDQVIEVLIERINPRGLFEISIVRQGRDRIEVTMPLPDERTQELRGEYELALSAFEDFTLDADAIERALRLSGDERAAALEGLMTSAPRRAMLEPLAGSVRAADDARAAFESAAAQDESGIVAEPLDQAALDGLLDAAGEAQERLDDARRSAIASSVEPQDVREALARSTETSTIRNEQTGEYVTLPSPRERALEALSAKLEPLPGGADTLAAAIAAYDTYVDTARGLDNPEDLQRLLQGAGVLEFRISAKPNTIPDEASLRDQVATRGPAGVESDTARWFSLNKLEDWVDTVEDLDSLRANPQAYFSSRHRLIVEPYEGDYYALMLDTPGKRLTEAEGEWGLSSAFQTSDDFGRPAVGFRMNPRGSALLGVFSEANIEEPMAVLLDGRVYTVATIRDRLTDRVQISGNFSQREIGYLIQTLNAGSLQARLSEAPISVSTLAPELGADNLRKGLTAGWIALVLVSIFMMCYYFSQGVVATIALACNAIIILGAMSLNRAAFTLPGIAGIILTFGMAVDSNVLIYERIREELNAGEDLRTAVREAYKKVLSTIVDANITNLIVCFVLAYTATQEIKGFAITLGIGVIATMFSALLVTRVVFVLLIDHVKIKKMSQLPIAIPAIDRLLTPKINWIGLRPLFVLVSAGFIALGISLVVIQQEEMLDTEFRGGTAIDLLLEEPEDTDVAEFAGAPYAGTLTRAQVQAVIEGVADRAERALDADPEDPDAGQLQQLRTASIQVIDPQADGVTSERFKIKTTATDTELLQDTIVDAFAGVVSSKPPLSFEGSTAVEIRDAPVFPVIDDALGENLPGRADVRNDVSRFVGGAVVLLQNLSPAPAEADLLARLDYLRQQGDYISDTSRRDYALIVIDGTAEAVETAAILAKDPLANALYDEDEWRSTLAESEWEIATQALAEATTLAGVQSFSAEVAATFRAKAIVAVVLSFMLITLYIWARFGSLRYSMAAIVCLIHDVIIVLGLIALAEIVYAVFPGAAAIGIQPFKIDLGLVAALLTIIGYSLNDTIIILDRIRENRGRLAYASKDVVNLSINQTISRTLITSGTTLMALIVMFLIGGEAIASFTYALICGVIVGTYSSIAVAAPLVFTSKIPPSAQPFRYEADAAAPASLEGAAPA
jgi:SecD/SecF fusion protein